MRRLLLQTVLPFLMCGVPFLAAFLVVVATPATALRFYLDRVAESHLDWIILGSGILLFLLQTGCMFRALQWRGAGFDERFDRWITNLAQAAEWFPLLGLLGTVFGIMDAFRVVAANPNVGAQGIISAYAPAVTATGSGLFMALLNLLPTWIVTVGRDFILVLGGGTPAPPAEERP